MNQLIEPTCYKKYSRTKVTSWREVSDVGDEIYRRQLWDVGDGFDHFRQAPAFKRFHQFLRHLWSRWDSRGYKATLRYENHWLKSNSFTPINFCQLKAQINWCEWVWFWSMILMTLFDTNAISLNCVSTRWLKGDCQWKSDILILVLISFKHNWNQKILFRSLYVPLHRFPAGLDRFRCGHFHYGCFTVLVDLVISILKISKPLDEHFSGISEPRWSIDKPKSTNHN